MVVSQLVVWCWEWRTCRFSREEMHDVLGVVRRKKGKAKNKKEEQEIKNGTEGMWELRAFVGLIMTIRAIQTIQSAISPGTRYPRVSYQQTLTYTYLSFPSGSIRAHVSGLVYPGSYIRARVLPSKQLCV